MKTNPYLFFKGDCVEALRFYEEVLGAKVSFKLTSGEGPGGEALPEEEKSKIMHASVQIGDVTVMVSDCPENRYSKPAGFGISLTVPKASEAEALFARLSEGGTVMMPMEKTFWAARFGVLADKFQQPWMIGGEAE